MSYIKIIELCMDFKQTLRDQKSSSWKRALHPLSTGKSTRFEDAIAIFKKQSHLVEKEAQICHMIEEKNSRELVLRNEELAEMRRRRR